MTFLGEIIIFSEEKRKDNTYWIHKNEEEKNERQEGKKQDIFGWKNVQKETKYDGNLRKWH